MKRHGPFKLSRRAVRLFYDIHSWVGIIGGLAFFICCFTGSLALFEQELIAWEKPETRSVPEANMLGVDELFAKAQERLGDEHDIFVMLPTAHNGGFQARAFSEGDVEEIFLDPYSGEVIESSHDTAFEFLTHLHTDLHLPRPIGRYLVGLLGIFLMMSLISGVMAHPKFLKDMFLLRWRPRIRLTFSDLHKQLGVWGLAFGLVMAFTGAVIGLLGLFAPVMVLSAFGGDVGQATEAFSGPSFEPTEVEADMLSIAGLIEDTEAQHPRFTTSSFFVRHWDDETAEVALNLEPTPYEKLVSGETHRRSLVDGETLHVSAFTRRGVGARLFGAMQPVHYGLFGGLGLKLLYFVSGLVLSFGIVSGSVIWLERRTDKAKSGKGRYFWLGRLQLGTCLGLVIASALAVATGRFAPAGIEPVFWISWLILLVGAFFVRNGFAAVRAGSLATAAILASVALFDLFGSTIASSETRGVNFVLLALSLTVAAIGVLMSNWGMRPRESRVAASANIEPGNTAQKVPLT